jgi:arabinogalactan oligomer/maltooligosaccharide transport system substrate-binding protein
MSKKLFALISLLMVFAFVLSACSTPATQAPAVEQPAAEEPADVATEAPMEEEPAAEEPAVEEPAAEALTITLWTKEGETDGGLQYVQGLADAYTAEHPNVTFEVVNKEVETLREDFQTASLAGAAPDLLWTVSDHLGPFTAADLIQPVDELVDLTQFVESATAAVKDPSGQTWGVPISNGNHLMLIYNKDLIETAPANTDELIAMGKEFMAANPDKYALVFNQTEPFFAAPWLGGFGASVFADDGITPTLDTPEMVATHQFLYDIKFTEGILPAESDYDGADAMFKEGNAAMIINGDWSLAGYKETLGDKLGVAPIPQVSATGLWPAPMTSGVFFMIPKDLDEATLAEVVNFVNFVTDEANQTEMITALSRLPANKVALESELITNDPILSGSAEQMTYGTPMPTVLEMRCIWDSWKPEMQAVLSDSKTPQDAMTAAQTAAVSCVENLE